MAQSTRVIDPLLCSSHDGIHPTLIDVKSSLHSLLVIRKQGPSLFPASASGGMTLKVGRLFLQGWEACNQLIFTDSARELERAELFGNVFENDWTMTTDDNV